MEHNDFFFAPVPDSQQRREKLKSRDLRKSQWWRQEVGRGICYHCEQKFLPKDLTMDHLIPIVRGGLTNKRNCVPSCKTCNSKKSHMTRAEMALKDLQKSEVSDL